MKLDELIGKIESCKLCEGIVFNGFVNVGEKPYIKYGVYGGVFPILLSACL